MLPKRYRFLTKECYRDEGDVQAPAQVWPAQGPHLSQPRRLQLVPQLRRQSRHSGRSGRCGPGRRSLLPAVARQPPHCGCHPRRARPGRRPPQLRARIRELGTRLSFARGFFFAPSLRSATGDGCELKIWGACTVAVSIHPSGHLCRRVPSSSIATLDSALACSHFPFLSDPVEPQPPRPSRLCRAAASARYF